jgi:hypothetical protein
LSDALIIHFIACAVAEPIYRFLGISGSLKATTSIKMIEVYMLVGLILCFNDILIQCYLQILKKKKKPIKKQREDDIGEIWKLSKQEIFDLTMNPGSELLHGGYITKQKQPQ